MATGLETSLERGPERASATAERSEQDHTLTLHHGRDPVKHDPVLLSLLMEHYRQPGEVAVGNQADARRLRRVAGRFRRSDDDLVQTTQR